MSDSDDIQRIIASAGSADFERILDLVEAMLTGAAIDQRRDAIEPAHHAALTIAAGGFLAGYLFGGTIIAGLARDQDVRRAGQMVLTNFRQGVKVGKDSTMRAMPTEGRA